METKRNRHGMTVRHWDTQGNPIDPTPLLARLAVQFKLMSMGLNPDHYTITPVNEDGAAT